jgi:hypothetical protein
MDRVVIGQKIELKCQTLIEKKLNEINARLEHSPQKFFTHLAHETRISKSSA